MDSVSVSLAFIDGLGGMEMLLVFVIALLLFGGDKLPGFARSIGKTMREFKKAASGVEEEFKRALEDDERKENAKRLAASSPAATEPAPPYADDHGYGHDGAAAPANTSPASPAASGPTSAADPAAPAAAPASAPADAALAPPAATIASDEPLAPAAPAPKPAAPPPSPAVKPAAPPAEFL